MKENNKIRIIIFGVIAIMIGFFIAQTTDDFTYADNYFVESDKKLEHSDIHEVYKNVMPAVVNISAEKVVEVRSDFFNMFEEFFGREFDKKRRTQSMGSGFIINKKGYIVTNNHVISKAEDIVVKLSDGKTKKAEVVGTDPEIDIAVLKIEPERDLPTVIFGNSDEIKIGDWAIAIGNPFGLERTLTRGIISAKGRDIDGITRYGNFIQTDAAINSGNSGGPLLNINGEVIAINTAKIGGTAQNIGFAIPINMAKKVIKQLIEKGKVERAYLGITGENVTPESKKALKLEVNEGVIIREVEKNSPADKAGIKAGDVIAEVEGKKIDNMRELAREIGLSEPGKKVRLKILRDDEKLTVTAKLEKMDKYVTSEENSLGLKLKNVKKGVKIIEIDRRSPFSGILKVDDIILQINRENVDDIEGFNDLIDKYKESSILYLTVERSGRVIFIPLRR